MKNLKINIKIAKQVEKEIIESQENLKKDEITEIINNVYVSGYKFSLDKEFLERNCFTHILTCSGASKRYTPIYHDKLEYLVLNIVDSLEFDIIKSLNQSIHFIDNCLEKKGKILIHCVEGVSRAPTVLSSYLMWKYSYNSETAVSLIKQKRSCVDINLGFLVQLKKWEEYLKETRNTEIILNRLAECSLICL